MESTKAKGLNELPAGADVSKVATVQALRKAGVTYRKIEEMLKISQKTIARYAKVQTDDVKQMEGVIKKHWLVSDFRNADKAYNELSVRLDTPENIGFRDLVGAFKIFRELQLQGGQGGGAKTAIQININGKLGNVSIEDGTTLEA